MGNEFILAYKKRYRNIIVTKVRAILKTYTEQQKLCNGLEPLLIIIL